MMPALRAISSISRAASSVVAIGFCTCTGLPLAAQARTTSSLNDGNVQTSTKSTSGWRHTSSYRSTNSAPCAAANARPLSAVTFVHTRTL
jgi:hypothetical protein